MATKCFLLLAACLVLCNGAVVRREAGQPEGSFLADVVTHAAEFSKTFSDQFKSIANSKNTQEVNKVFKESSDSVLQQISAFSNTLQDAIRDASGKTKEALEQTRQNVQRAAEELRQAHPDVEQQATALRDRLQAAVQTTVQETQKLAKEVSANVEQSNQQLAPKIKAAYDDFVKQAQEVQKKALEAANKQ